ncbi:hypothetical protein CEXT_488001 [Caerostris extrusa]|uniref:Orn/DAP/Arg decarboxylase 2 N-terminal domain-containing protein n=1 Tax=Caerostris extrusa TaxID=172846 RepID=A0AAV4Y4P9_CAEEX|nr:hypothetical protein CEXT_488001 [Caerostris extrusa]
MTLKCSDIEERDITNAEQLPDRGKRGKETGCRRLARKKNIVELRDEPFLIFDAAEVEKKVKEWKEAMPRVSMFYAVKANSDPVLLQTLAALNVGFECGSKVS